MTWPIPASIDQSLAIHTGFVAISHWLLVAFTDFLHCLQLNGGYNPKPMVKSPAVHTVVSPTGIVWIFSGYGPSLDKPKENVVDELLIYYWYSHSMIRYPYHFTQLLDFLSYVNVNKIPTYTMIFHIIYPMIFHRESPWSSHIISPRRYLHLVPLTHIHGFSYPLDDFRERAQAENQWALQVKDAGNTGHFGGSCDFFFPYIHIYYTHTVSCT